MTAEVEWVRRNVTDENRVADVVELYESFGYEVKIVDYNPIVFDNNCNECMQVTPEKFKIVYTRIPSGFNGDLFDV